MNQLDEIEARANAATEGPWEAAVYEYGMQDGRIRVTSPSDSGLYNLAEDVLPADAAFIAHARTDIPALLDTVREQQEEIRRYAAEDAEAFMMRQVTESPAKLRATIKEQQARLDAVRDLADWAGKHGWTVDAAAIRKALEQA
jgi:hypothetical protein